MKATIGSKVPLCLLIAGLTLSAAPSLLAQHEAGQSQGPSKYLYLTNVDLKAEQSNDTRSWKATRFRPCTRPMPPATTSPCGPSPAATMCCLCTALTPSPICKRIMKQPWACPNSWTL